MIVKQFESRDYEILLEWWHHWNWPKMPLDALPRNGLVVSAHDGEPLAMGFIYLSDSSIGWVEWITANPFIKEERATALDLLISELIIVAKSFSKSILFTTMNKEKTPGLVKKMENFGFQVTDKSMTNLIARI